MKYEAKHNIMNYRNSTFVQHIQIELSFLKITFDLQH